MRHREIFSIIVIVTDGNVLSFVNGVETIYNHRLLGNGLRLPLLTTPPPPFIRQILRHLGEVSNGPIGQ